MAETERPAKIPYGAISNMAMVNGGNEEKFTLIIHQNVVKKWVAIGWIHVRVATEDDYLSIPEVEG